MENKNDLPKRKATRLKNYDYSSRGAYFVTICTKDRKQLLSEIIKNDSTYKDNTNSVGEGLAPPEQNSNAKPVWEGLAPPEQNCNAKPVGEGLAPPEYVIKLKPCGAIARKQLLLIKERFSSVSIEDFVIMPDHIHAIIFLENMGGASPSPTLNDIICAFKSLTSCACKKEYGIEKMFQRSYAEHIIRDRQDYDEHKKYIYENPIQWYYKHLEDE